MSFLPNKAGKPNIQKTNVFVAAPAGNDSGPHLTEIEFTHSLSKSQLSKNKGSLSRGEIKNEENGKPSAIDAAV